ncbi:DUF72 domain-containing protein [Pseudomonas stutzeri]|nr:DUF72 domain-containing protein [Stutzerimonas degradans]QPT23545.1 DUF72 domain-containing protein [Stutzerimonas degradans]
MGSLYPPGTPPAQFLAQYCSVFNSVEGNTTLYAWPAEQTIRRWALQMPEDFRFCAKLPREISQADDLRAALELAQSFKTLLAPLGRRVTPFWLQLPASFGPARLAELATLIEDFAAPLAVEVRHPAFFDKGAGERALNRLLRDHAVERICLDARALFSCRSREPALLHAQSKKPRVPVRPAAFSASPQLRFIGHPQLEANDVFMQPWLERVAAWIEAGKTPHVYLHTPDNHRAPELALRFHAQLRERLPGLPALRPLYRAPQLSLLDE